MFCHDPRVLIKVRHGSPVVADFAIYAVTLLIVLPSIQRVFLVGTATVVRVLAIVLIYLPSLPDRTLPVERLVLSRDFRIVQSLRCPA